MFTWHFTFCPESSVMKLLACKWAKGRRTLWEIGVTAVPARLVRLPWTDPMYAPSLHFSMQLQHTPTHTQTHTHARTQTWLVGSVCVLVIGMLSVPQLATSSRPASDTFDFGTLTRINWSNMGTRACTHAASRPVELGGICQKFPFEWLLVTLPVSAFAFE